MSRTITTPEVVIDGGLPRSPLERIYRISHYFEENRKLDALVAEAEAKADENGYYEFMHEIEDELTTAVNEGLDSAVLMPGVDPGDLILYPTNEDGLPVDENGEELPE
jgi:hypothetical protein